MKAAYGFSAILVSLLLVAPLAQADAPPFEYSYPANGGQYAVTSPDEDGVVNFACPRWTDGIGGSWSNYWVNFATSPDLNPQGELATPFKIWIAHAYPTNAAEDQCTARFSHYYSSNPGTYYWQVTRNGCFEPECTRSKGPVWGFTLVSATPTEGGPGVVVGGSNGGNARVPNKCRIAGRVKARRGRAVRHLQRILAAGGRQPAAIRRLNIRLRTAKSALRKAKRRVAKVC